MNFHFISRWRGGGQNSARRRLRLMSSLVRDELSAVETYRAAVKTASRHAALVELRRIEDDHEQAVILLQEQIASSGEEPPTRSGVWRHWTRHMRALSQGGDAAGISALKAGEEHDIRHYERALRDASLDRGIKFLIGAKLLPRSRSHVLILEEFLRDKAN